VGPEAGGAYWRAAGLEGADTAPVFLFQAEPHHGQRAARSVPWGRCQTPLGGVVGGGGGLGGLGGWGKLEKKRGQGVTWQKKIRPGIRANVFFLVSEPLDRAGGPSGSSESGDGKRTRPGAEPRPGGRVPELGVGARVGARFVLRFPHENGFGGAAWGAGPPGAAPAVGPGGKRLRPEGGPVRRSGGGVRLR